MGLLSFIKNATSGKGSGNVISLNASLGNVLIAGNSKHGAEVVIKNYAIDSVNKGFGVIVFKDINTGMSAYPSIASSREIYSVDCSDNSVTEQIDVFSKMNDSEINSYIIKLFDIYNQIDKNQRMSFQNYIAVLRNLAKKAGKCVKLNTLFDFPIEEVENLNLRYCNGVEQSRNDRFLNSMRLSVKEIEAYFYDFANNAAGYVLSGNRSLEKIFSSKKIIEIALNISGKSEESLLIMTAVIDAISRFELSASTVNSVNVIVDGIPNEIMINSGLQKLIKGTQGFNVLYNVQDISNLVDKSNEWIDYADSYFFFRQNSNKNKEFCSELFGTYEKAKKTVTKGDSKPSFWNIVNGRGTVTTQNSTSVTMEKERVYKPEVFAGLPENQAIYYCKKSNEHTYLTVF